MTKSIKKTHALIILPNPSFGSFFRETHKTSLSVDDPSFVGVSARHKVTYFFDIFSTELIIHEMKLK